MAVTGFSNYLEMSDAVPFDTNTEINFGPINIEGEQHEMTFTINNTGTGELVISACTIEKTSTAGAYSITVPPAGTIPVSGSTTFTVLYAATTGAYTTDTAKLTLETNDPDDGDFILSFSGVSCY